MNLVLIGPPGCGKGTQGERIAGKYKIPRISTGDMFRQAVREQTEFGRKVKDYIDGGMLVPDDVTIELIRERLKSRECEAGCILDGFPRTVVQAAALDGLLEEIGRRLDLVLFIDVEDDEVVRRLSGRRQCPNCGAAYHLEFDPPKREGICDRCQERLYQRDDDNEETIRGRLRVYKKETEPLLEYYKGKGILKRIDGKGSMDKVFKDICYLIESSNV